MVNRALSVADSYWPSLSPSRPKPDLVSGVHLAEGTVEEFTASLKGEVDDVADVTYAFYFGGFENGSIADRLWIYLN